LFEKYNETKKEYDELFTEWAIKMFIYIINFLNVLIHQYKN
jgi:hypothetical protein